jgi:putative hydroxymethylpyrimidine transport system substrate-binding protein
MKASLRKSRWFRCASGHSIQLLALLLALCPLVGCGGGSEGEATESGLLKRQNVSLDGAVGPANIGVRLAADRGYFEGIGIQAEVAKPAFPARPAAYVTNGFDEFGLTQLPQLLIARDRGMPLTAIGSIVPQATAAMIWLKRSKIGGIAGLKGKTIGIPGVAFQEEFLPKILERSGLKPEDVTIKKVHYGPISALVSGRVDAIFGATWNIEGAALEARGLDPVIKRVTSLGVPDYDEVVVIARSDLVAEEPELVREVMSTIRQGVADAREDPAAAAEAIAEDAGAGLELDGKEVRAGLDATRPLLSESGRLDPARAEQLARWMHEEGMIQEVPSVSEYLTNDFVSDR